jgi:hypothetical protein
VARLRQSLRQGSHAGAATDRGPKAWAWRIIARHDAGEKVRPICLRFAREALQLPQGRV